MRRQVVASCFAPGAGPPLGRKGRSPGLVRRAWSTHRWGQVACAAQHADRRSALARRDGSRRHQRLQRVLLWFLGRPPLPGPTVSSPTGQIRYGLTTVLPCGMPQVRRHTSTHARWWMPCLPSPAHRECPTSVTSATCPRTLTPAILTCATALCAALRTAAPRCGPCRGGAPRVTLRVAGREAGGPHCDSLRFPGGGRPRGWRPSVVVLWVPSPLPPRVLRCRRVPGFAWRLPSTSVPLLT